MCGGDELFFVFDWIWVGDYVYMFVINFEVVCLNGCGIWFDFEVCDFVGGEDWNDWWDFCIDC